MVSPGPTSASAPTPAISDAQLIEIARGEEREKRFAFARKLARFNGVGLGIFAVVSLVSAVFDPGSLLLAVPLGAIALAELHGGLSVARYERRGLLLLAANQLALIALIAIYALSQIYSALHEPSPIADMMAQGGVQLDELGSSELGAGLGAGLDDFDGMYRSAISAFYGAVIAATALIQGGCAYYYYSRLNYLDRFLAETPRWVVDWLRARKR